MSLDVGGTAGQANILQYKGYQQISAATLASATFLSVPTGSLFAVIVAEGTGATTTGNGALVRYRADGTAPTGTIGTPIAAMGNAAVGVANPLVTNGPLGAYQFILAAGGANAIPVLNIAYYG